MFASKLLLLLLPQITWNRETTKETFHFMKVKLFSMFPLCINSFTCKCMNREGEGENESEKVWKWYFFQLKAAEPEKSSLRLAFFSHTSSGSWKSKSIHLKTFFRRESSGARKRTSALSDAGASLRSYDVGLMTFTNNRREGESREINPFPLKQHHYRESWHWERKIF